MMRVLSSMGRLVEVSSVMPVAEKEIVFNGRKKRFFEKAQGLAQKPTGIVFYSERAALMASSSSFYIGNLRPEKVQSLMKEMLERGYCDLSRMEYQQAKMSPELVIDGGESPAYSSEITIGSFPTDLRPCGFSMGHFGGMDGFDCGTDDDDEFSYEEDEED